MSSSSACTESGSLAVPRSASARRSASGRLETRLPFEPSHVRREAPDLFIERRQTCFVLGPERHRTVLPGKETGQSFECGASPFDELGRMNTMLSGQLRKCLL